MPLCITCFHQDDDGTVHDMEYVEACSVSCTEDRMQINPTVLKYIHTHVRQNNSKDPSVRFARTSASKAQKSLQ